MSVYSQIKKSFSVSLLISGSKVYSPCEKITCYSSLAQHYLNMIHSGCNLEHNMLKISLNTYEGAHQEPQRAHHIFLVSDLLIYSVKFYN